MDDGNTENPGPPDDSQRNNEPITELADFSLDDPDELRPRIQRSINRRLFASDAVEFSLSVLVQTFWDYLRTITEAILVREDIEKGKRNG